MVWPHITRNWVVTCENRISTPVIPDTRHLSRMPSLRSINIAPEVSATERKNMMLQVIDVTKFEASHKVKGKTYVRITPGAAKSVKFGVRSP